MIFLKKMFLTAIIICVFFVPQTIHAMSEEEHCQILTATIKDHEKKLSRNKREQVRLEEDRLKLREAINKPLTEPDNPFGITDVDWQKEFLLAPPDAIFSLDNIDAFCFLEGITGEKLGAKIRAMENKDNINERLSYFVNNLPVKERICFLAMLTIGMYNNKVSMQESLTTTIERNKEILEKTRQQYLERECKETLNIGNYSLNGEYTVTCRPGFESSCPSGLIEFGTKNGKIDGIIYLGCFTRYVEGTVDEEGTIRIEDESLGLQMDGKVQLVPESPGTLSGSGPVTIKTSGRMQDVDCSGEWHTR